MSTQAQNIRDALDAIQKFTGSDLGNRIAGIEFCLHGMNAEGCRAQCTAVGAGSELLAGAYAVKRAAAQINVLIHAVGALILLPKMLTPDEHIESVSLGAGNTGKPYDLETNLRVAEFKFINWQGGAETMRKKSLFKDFYRLAEAETTKRKELYLLGLDFPLKFLRSQTGLDSAMSKNVPLLAAFKQKYGERFKTVGDYYRFRQNDVNVIDASPLVPELVGMAEASDDVDP